MQRTVQKLQEQISNMKEKRPTFKETRQPTIVDAFQKED